jgi:hypothetical protein
MAIGIAYFAIGLAKKCWLADSFALAVAPVFGPSAGTRRDGIHDRRRAAAATPPGSATAAQGG